MRHQESQCLEIGNGVVKPPPVHAAINNEPLMAFPQSMLHRQHHVGVVLFNGKSSGAVRHKPQRVEIAQYRIRDDSQSFGMVQAAIHGNHIVIPLDWLQQAAEITGSNQDAASHLSAQSGWTA